MKKKNNNISLKQTWEDYTPSERTAILQKAFDYYKDWAIIKDRSSGIPLLEDFCSTVRYKDALGHERIGMVDPELIKNDPEFRDFMIGLKNLQKANIVNGSLLNEYNGGFAKFFASAELDMVERKETDVNITEDRKIEETLKNLSTEDLKKLAYSEINDDEEE